MFQQILSRILATDAMQYVRRLPAKRSTSAKGASTVEALIGFITMISVKKKLIFDLNAANNVESILATVFVSFALIDDLKKAFQDWW